MKNKELAVDYLIRSQKRLKAIQTLYDEKSWADVVRESQEVVELSLKGLLRFSNMEVPRIHDVGGLLLEHLDQLPVAIRGHVKKLAKISHDMRRDRELAFYGSEDLTPSEFYSKEDADKAKKDAIWLVQTVAESVLPG